MLMLLALSGRFPDGCQAGWPSAAALICVSVGEPNSLLFCFPSATNAVRTCLTFPFLLCSRANSGGAPLLHLMQVAPLIPSAVPPLGTPSGVSCTVKDSRPDSGSKLGRAQCSLPFLLETWNVPVRGISTLQAGFGHGRVLVHSQAVTVA